jgi:formimidoylglutamate deiminase
VTYVPDLLYLNGRFEAGRALVCDASGSIVATPRLDKLHGQGMGERSFAETGADVDFYAGRVVRLPGRALLPGMVNAHSHAFQRVIRGRTEYRSAASTDSFWTWREMMYAAAERLSPEDVYDAARMAFLEMALGGITTVGEFHYLHRAPGGAQYEDANLLAKAVVGAAREVGLRVALLRVAYARSGFGQPPHARQSRFVEPDPETFTRHTEALVTDLAREARPEGGPALAWVGVAPHSVRAVPAPYLRVVRDFAAERRLVLHMHVAEQPAEIEACLAETGRTPVKYLADEGLLSQSFTGVHAVHVTSEEVSLLACARAMVCACPTTERNLGDGVVPAEDFFRAGVMVSLGTDSHAQIDLLEDARELEYHLRLTRLARNVLAPEARPRIAQTREDSTRAEEDGHELSALAARLFSCASASGARSLGLAGGGEFVAGSPADFFTVDLYDPSVAGAGAEDLLAAVVFSLTRAAVREVAVGGRLVVEDGRHTSQREIVERFDALQKRLWR